MTPEELVTFKKKLKTCIDRAIGDVGQAEEMDPSTHRKELYRAAATILHHLWKSI